MEKGLKLNVKYVDKERAKEAGAKWDPKDKTWYLPLDKSVDKVIEWIDPDWLIYGKNKTKKLGKNVSRYYFLVRSGYPCNKCKSGMDILMPFSKPPKNREHTKPYEYDLTWNKPKSYVDFAMNLGVKMEYRTTRIIKEPYALHICPKCNAIQGDFYIFEDKDCMLPVKKAFYAIYDSDIDMWEIE